MSEQEVSLMDSDASNLVTRPVSEQGTRLTLQDTVIQGVYDFPMDIREVL